MPDEPSIRNDPELTAYILERLSSMANTDDLVLDICQKTGLHWNEAEAWVETLKVQHESEISRRQSPLLVTLAVVIFLGGAEIASAAGYFLYETALDALHTDDSLARLDLFLYLFRAAPDIISIGVFGGAMMAGSSLGLYQIWSPS